MSSSIKTLAKNSANQSASIASNYLPDHSSARHHSDGSGYNDKGLLYVKPLYARRDTITLGQAYRDVLDLKRKEYEDLLQDTKSRLEPDTEETTATFDGSLYQEELNSIHTTYQKQLDLLTDKLQKEWMKDPRQKAEIPVVPSGSDDSQYLARHLGVALKRALAEVSDKRPWDPIEYLGLWLHKYADNVQREKQEAIEKIQLKLQQEEEATRQQHEDRLAYERRFIEIDEQRRKELFLKRAKEVEELEKKAEEAEKERLKRESEHHVNAGNAEPEEEQSKEDQPSRDEPAKDETFPQLYTIEEKDTARSTDGVTEPHDKPADDSVSLKNVLHTEEENHLPKSEIDQPLTNIEQKQEVKLPETENATSQNDITNSEFNGNHLIDNAENNGNEDESKSKNSKQGETVEIPQNVQPNNEDASDRNVVEPEIPTGGLESTIENSKLPDADQVDSTTPEAAKVIAPGERADSDKNLDELLNDNKTEKQTTEDLGDVEQSASVEKTDDANAVQNHVDKTSEELEKEVQLPKESATQEEDNLTKDEVDNLYEKSNLEQIAVEEHAKQADQAQDKQKQGAKVGQEEPNLLGTEGPPVSDHVHQGDQLAPESKQPEEQPSSDHAHPQEEPATLNTVNPEEQAASDDVGTEEQTASDDVPPESQITADDTQLEQSINEDQQGSDQEKSQMLVQNYEQQSIPQLEPEDYPTESNVEEEKLATTDDVDGQQDDEQNETNPGDTEAETIAPEDTEAGTTEADTTGTNNPDSGNTEAGDTDAGNKEADDTAALTEEAT